MDNKNYVHGMQELRRSNASGTHKDKRSRRARTRAAAKIRAMKEW